VALERAGIPFTVHEYARDPRRESYGREASQAMGVPPERVFKTLIAEVDGNLVAGVVPVTGQLDLKALAAAAGGKPHRRGRELTGRWRPAVVLAPPPIRGPGSMCPPART
jgi:prolyl-tRNA editing enzyme YbaK/EbsC (Cys-tRNA(Pro) deacylase)